VPARGGCSLGTPVEPRNCTRVVQTAVQRAGLPAVRLHDFRHGCVSVLLALGVPPRTVMEIAGHATLEMTMNVYAHVTLVDKRTALDQLGELLDDQDQDQDGDDVARWLSGPCGSTGPHESRR
jgi:integrase